MIDARSGVVVDTMVVSWLFDERPSVAERSLAVIGQRPVMVAFQTVMELRYGALRAGWGELRKRRLERRIAGLVVVQPDGEMITACAELRSASHQIGHPLGDKSHDGDRWIAAAAIRLRIPLVSDDPVFEGAPGLVLLPVSKGL